MFGELLVAHRRRVGLTQEELAAKAGLSVRTVRELESGRDRVPRPASVRLLADALGLRGAEREEFHNRAGGVAEPSAGAAAFRGGGAGPVPAQLPADVAGFAGRTAELSRLDDLVAGAGAAGSAGAVVISAVSGTAGVGKTALAVHWAHRVADRFPDGQLYVNLRGFDPGGHVTPPSRAVCGFLAALGVAPERIPPDLDAQTALYRSLLAGRRMLIVLDNARDAEQARPLLPGTPTTFTVVTSRNDLTPLVVAGAAYPISLDLLSPREARDVLTRRLGPQRVAAEPDAVETIIAACARLPLALAIAAARGRQSDFRLAAIAGELADTASRLDALDAGDPGSQVRTVFSWSYDTLTAGAAQLFRLLGLHPGPEISVPAAAALIGRPAARARRLLAELTHANLLTEPVPGRYTCHDLLRTYAAELLQDQEPTDGQLAARRRMLDHYLHTAYAAARLLHPTREQINVPLAGPVPGAFAEPLVDRDQAVGWLGTEQPTLLAVVQLAAAAGYDTHAWQLAWTLVDHLDWRGHWHDLMGVHLTALEAARRQSLTVAQAVSHRCIGHALVRLNRGQAGEEHLRRALRLFAEAGDAASQGNVHLKLALVCARSGRVAELLDHNLKALELLRSTDDKVGLGRALNAVGWSYLQHGQPAEALRHARQGLAVHESLGDAHGQADTLDTLGAIHQRLGEYEDAEECYRRALHLIRQTGNRYYEAVALIHIADLRLARGDNGAGRTGYRQALEILSELRHPSAESVRATLAKLDRVR